MKKIYVVVTAKEKTSREYFSQPNASRPVSRVETILCGTDTLDAFSDIKGLMSVVPFPSKRKAEKAARRWNEERKGWKMPY